MNMNKVEMNDNMMERINGGARGDYGRPSFGMCDDIFVRENGLDNIVRPTGGFTDAYFDICENGTWRNVGSADMVNFVKNTFGSNDKRYLAAKEYLEKEIRKRFYF